MLRKAFSILLFLMLFPMPWLQGQSAGTLVGGFQNPPRECRPIVWWHWMNGNVTKEGIRKDLLWMDEVGIGGFQNFDAGFETPTVVKERLPYMSRGWKSAFNHSLDLADSLGMTVGIASSPGWSLTGGPWVSKEDAMKKLVWKETIVQGPTRFRDTLACPPVECGSYQNSLAFAKDPHRYDFYKDICVVAVRMSDSDLTMQEMGATLSTSDGSSASSLLDGNLDVAQKVEPDADGFSWVCIEFPEPRTIKSIFTSRAYSERGNYSRCLEASDDGQTWKMVCPRAPESATLINVFDIPSTTSRFFRIRSTIAGKPLNYAEVSLSPVTKVNDATEKAGFFTTFSLRDFYQTPQTEDAVSEKDVHVLTSCFKDGRLDWKVPRGRWKIYRFGYNLTGRRNGPASEEATGLEVDKLDKEAVARYFRNYFDMYEKAAPGRVGKTLSQLMIDSYEVRCQNWTERMAEEFEARRGYSLVPWLPALAGEVISSAEKTERFLFDWRQTISELMAQSHYDTAGEIAHEYGITRFNEAHEYNRVCVADGMDMRRTADVPTAAFWMREFYSSYPAEETDMREAASVSHIYGQNICAAESFTTNGMDPDCWGHKVARALHPGNMKPAADASMASGQNFFIIHSSVHQPLDDNAPGLTLSRHGSWFNRHETWAGEARPFIDYLTRSSYLLRQGRNVADIAFYYGETTNAVARFKLERPQVPAGYSYDFVNRTALLEALELQDGRLVAPSGATYSMLVIDREVKFMSMAVLRKIAQLAREGMVIIGDAPSEPCELMADDAQFRALVDEVWNSGRTNVIRLTQVQMALHRPLIPKDVDFDNPTNADIRFVHRHLDSGELYWVANINPEARNLKVSFRVSGKKPVVLHADSGEIEVPTYRMEDGRTIVSLDFVPDDAQFILFEEDTDVAEHIVPRMSVVSSTEISQGWIVSFPEGLGAPSQVALDKLSLLNESTDPGIRHFSGTAEYAATFVASKPEAGVCILDLGEVHDMAHVHLNGKDLGLVWKKPFLVDVTDVLQEGENQLLVKVTNTWQNRVIGDLQDGAEKVIKSEEFPFFTADSPLCKSGMAGPVRLVQMK